MNIPLNIDWQQILLHLFNFAILAGGLYLLLYKPVGKFMDQRAEHYKKMDEESAVKKNEAERLKALYETRISEIEKEASNLRAGILKKAEAAAAERIQTAEEQAGRIVSDAKKQAQDESEKIIAGTQQEIVKLAAAAAQKVLASSENMYVQFIDAAKDGEVHE